MRYVASEDCKAKGPARALLWVIAYHADRDTGECWLGQRRLARESGVARSTVQRALDELFGDGVLEYVEDHRGPKPDRYQIAPGLVEGVASASGMVEGTASGSGMVEGQAVVGEVFHSPGSSGPGASPLAGTAEWLVDRSERASGPIGGPAGALVDRSERASGPMAAARLGGLTSAKAELSESQGYKQGSSTSRKEHVLDDASSAADAAGVVEGPTPPPSVLRELELRGLRPKSRTAPKPEQQPRTREEQLAILERIAAEDAAQARNSQEGKTSA
jgi:hypothetical protein